MQQASSDPATKTHPPPRTIIGASIGIRLSPPPPILHNDHQPTNPTAVPPEPDLHKELARANRAFYRAFEELDYEAMRGCWEDDDSIRCVHPGAQMLLGREAVLGSWRAIFAGRPQVSFELADLEFRVLGAWGWVACEERLTARDDDEPDPARRMSEFRAVATNLYLWREGRWRMVLHHASPLARRMGPDEDA